MIYNNNNIFSYLEASISAPLHDLYLRHRCFRNNGPSKGASSSGHMLFQVLVINLTAIENGYYDGARVDTDAREICLLLSLMQSS